MDWIAHDRWLVFSVGLAFGLMHLPVSLELAVTLNFHGTFIQTVLLLVYPLALALTGVGAALSMRVPWLARGEHSLRLAGGAMLALLLASLRLNFMTREEGPLLLAALAHIGALGTWFLVFGGTLSGALERLRATPARIGPAWALHLGGLVLGYAAAEPLVVQVGANGLLLAVGLALLGAARAWPLALAPMLAIFLARSPDGWLEDHRSVDAAEQVAALEGGGAQGDEDEAEDGWIDQDVTWKDKRASNALSLEQSRVYLGWSRYGQVQVIDQRREGRYGMLYNYKYQYEICPGCDWRSLAESLRRLEGSGVRVQRESGQRTPTRAALYGVLPPGEPLLFSGVGAGRGLELLPFPLNKQITAVERDAGAVRLFTEDWPALNGGRFLETNTLNADGRHAVEVAPEPLAAIVLESSRYQPSHSMLPASAPYYLHTREAILTYLAQLKPGGLLMVEFTRAGEAASHRYVPLQVLATLARAGVEHTVVRSGSKDSVSVLACPGAGCLARWTEAIDLSGLNDVSYGWDVEDGPWSYTLTDDTPFVSWATMKGKERRRLLALAGALTALAAAGAAGLWRRGRGEPGWNAAGWFFLLGAAHAALQLHAMYVWRAYFGDELRTILRVIVWFLVYGSLGSALAARMSPRWTGATWRVRIAAALLGLHLLGQLFIPFEQPSAPIREIYAAIALLPGGLLMGVFMPLGLARAPAARVGANLCADALGTLAGYAGMYLLMMPLGLRAYGAVAVALYLIVAARLGREYGAAKA